MIRVGISGGYGRMGTMIAEAVGAEPDLELAGRYDPSHGSHDLLAECQVVVEVTHPDVVMDNLAEWKRLGLHAVVGTSGFDTDRLEQVGELWEGAASNCLIVPNFSVGAVLLMRFAELAAPHFPMAEIIEYHHADKPDAPSGTALASARRVAGAQSAAHPSSSRELVEGARGANVDGVQVHSVRMAGLIADQDVIFGDLGQTLTLRHHTHTMQAFAPGVLASVRAVASLTDRVTVGLESILGV